MCPYCVRIFRARIVRTMYGLLLYEGGGRKVLCVVVTLCGLVILCCRSERKIFSGHNVSLHTKESI